MRKIILGLLLAFIATAALAQTKISALPAGAPGNSDVAPTVVSGTTSKSTMLQIGLGAVDQTATCLNTFPLATTKPLLVLNDGTTPTGIGCASIGSGTVPALSYDNNVDALIFPSGQVARFIGGPSGTGFIAFQFCTGASSFGGCTDAFDIGGGDTGEIFTRRNVLATGYTTAGGSQPTFTGTCTVTANTGGNQAGQVTISNTSTCDLTMTVGFGSGNIGQNGLACVVQNITGGTVAPQTASTVTSFHPTCTNHVTSTGSGGNVLVYSLTAY